MTWINKSKNEIRNAIIAIAKEETGLTSFKEGGVLRGLVEVYAQTVFPLYAEVINFYGGQFTYLKASGAMLDLRGQELGVGRLKARKAVGSFLAEAVKSSTITEGTWFVTSGGLRFKSTVSVVIYAGENNSIPVEAEFPGVAHNILTTMAVRTTAVIDGLIALTVPSGWISTPGRDEESDEDYKRRISAKWDTQGPDNRPGKYRIIALATPGVNDVKVIRKPRGSGSIDIVLGGDAGIPSQATCEAVKKAIGDAYLLTRDLLVKPATKEPREFALSYSGDVSESEVERTLRTWLQGRKIGAMITMQELYQSALLPLEVSDLEYQHPTKNIAVGSVSKVVPTSITVTRRSA